MWETIPNRQRVWWFVFHVKAHQRVTVAENDFRNQVWSILYGDPYFFSHSCHCLVGSWINGHDSRNGGYTWAQHHGLPLNKANLATPTAECPALAENCRRDQHKPLQVILFSRWNHPATAGYLHWDTSIMKGAALISFKLDTSSGYGFVFPNAPDKTISCRLQDALTHPNGIPHSITSDQVIYFTKKWSIAVGSCSWNSWVLMCSLSSWSSWLDWCNSYLKTCARGVATPWETSEMPSWMWYML